MPTKKTRLTFAVPDDKLSAIEAYRTAKAMKNVSATILALIDRGLRHEAPGAGMADDARDLALRWGALDDYGRQAVRELLAVEEARCADEARFLAESAPAPEPKVINLFEDAAAAGLVLAETGQGAVPYELGPDDPQGAAYAVRVRGDSMEPYFHDGSVAFVNHDPMRDGDVGVFCIDGAAVIKQWHRDELGITYLFSLNRARSDADVVVPPGSGRTLVWQGRVLTRRRFPLPDEV